jgi:hypothetical protein
LKFDSIFLIDEEVIDKEKSISEEKSKIICLRTQLDFFERLIEFMKGLIARKIDFKVNLGFNWKKLKFWG